ncbi:MAG: hypothetical protein HQL13_06920 [Candidatus Omnitrophica bacterium]|nr:hypothetical protein [Candidatus Omnitrophota bacterium]
MRRRINVFIIFFYLLSFVPGQEQALAQEALSLPQPGVMVDLSAAYVPVLIKGLRVHPDNPLLFDFILDSGQSGFKLSSPEFKAESQKLIKYFLAALTISENNLWVNLSPFERARIIPDELNKTQLGAHMLAQDYMLKQLTASLIYPEKKLGKEFWNKVYAKAKSRLGHVDIPVHTFNKVWIVADKAKVLERKNAGYVVAAHLRVMLEEDYLARLRYVIPAKAGIQNKICNHDNWKPDSRFRGNDNDSHINHFSSNIIRSIVLPELEKEVNQGRNFASLRQMFYSMILATWYKEALKEALLNQVYTNKHKTSGVLNDDMAFKEKIYQRYLKAYQKGVFNYIKEELSPDGQSTFPRKYFSGGVAPNFAMRVETTTRLDSGHVYPVGNMAMVMTQMKASKINEAMAAIKATWHLPEDSPLALLLTATSMAGEEKFIVLLRKKGFGDIPTLQKMTKSDVRMRLSLRSSAETNQLDRLEEALIELTGHGFWDPRKQMDTTLNPREMLVEVVILDLQEQGKTRSVNIVKHLRADRCLTLGQLQDWVVNSSREELYKYRVTKNDRPIIEAALARYLHDESPSSPAQAAVLQGNQAQNAAMTARKRNAPKPDLMQILNEWIPLNYRTVLLGALRQHGIRTIEQLKFHTPEDLIALRGFGDAGIKVLNQVLIERTGSGLLDITKQFDPHVDPLDRSPELIVQGLSTRSQNIVKEAMRIGNVETIGGLEQWVSDPFTQLKIGQEIPRKPKAEILARIKEYVEQESASPGQAALPPGGIDLNAKKMSMEVDRKDQAMAIKFNPALVAQFKQGKFSGIIADILSVTPILNALTITD